MPLKGEAKREYQRLYMRGYSRKTQKVAEAIPQLLGEKRGRPYTLSQDVQDTARAALGVLLRSKGLTAEKVVEKSVELLEATKQHTVAGVATISRDNDAVARAINEAKDWLVRAGEIPAGGSEMATTSSGARVRMVQIEPDGTERILEIG